VESVQSIREVLKSDLSIQVFYAGDKDLSQARQEYIKQMTSNIEVIDITKIFDSGYLQLKAERSRPLRSWRPGSRTPC